MPTLVIVDMQPHFPHANEESVIRANLQLIRRYRRRDWPIIVLEYDHAGRTNDRLVRALDGYHSVHYCKKRGDDGSVEVHRVVSKHGYDAMEFHVVGVNLGFCVRSTIFGLRRLYPEAHIHIFEEAVNGVWYQEEGEPDLERIKAEIVEIEEAGTPRISGVRLKFNNCLRTYNRSKAA